LTLRQIVDIIESVAPLRWQEEWDNSGLQVGERDAEIRAALVCVDVTEQVIQEAISRGCDLIISHHPLIFHGVRQLTGDTPQQRCLITAIRHNIAIYSAHTNMDSYLHGVSGEMAARCGVTDCRILCPADGGGEPQHGLGVIGTLPAPVPFTQFLQTVKTAFNAPSLLYILPARAQEVRTVAFCGGAGSEFINEAARQGADVYVTADCKYHEMQAAQGQTGIISLDHWVSEQFVRDIFLRLLQDQLPVFIAQTDRSPVKTL
jgi:dinuclear metal center YbgI/SA1388 family protein